MTEHEQDIIGVDKQEAAIELRRVSGKAVKPLWEINRWDGPLSGVCLYQDKPYYFNAVNEIGKRKFLLHPLSDEIFHALEEVREDFKNLVGEHCEYNPDWTRRDASVRENWRSFYEKHPEGSKSLNPTSEPAQLYFYIPLRRRQV